MKALNLRSLVAIIVVCLLILSVPATAQKTEPEGPPKVEITMNNGDVFSGTIIEETDNEIVLEGDSGTFRLQRSKIKKIVEVASDLKFSFENPNPTRYFFSPSAIGIKKKEGYYQNLLLVGNFVNYGISDNFSIGGGVEFISLMLGEPIWFFTPKVSTAIGERSHVAGGVFLGGMAGEGSFGIGYGSYTYGTSETNVTVSAGYGFVDGEVADQPIFALSGMHRVSNSIALVGENYLIPVEGDDAFYIGNYGIRFIGRKNSFDLGFIIIEELVSEIPALPFVGYVRQF